MIKHDIIFFKSSSAPSLHNFVSFESVDTNFNENQCKDLFLIYGVINSRGAFNCNVRTRLFQRRR